MSTAKPEGDLTSLHISAANGHFEICRTLVDPAKGGSEGLGHATDWRGEKALFYALIHRHKRIYDYLTPKFSVQGTNEASNQLVKAACRGDIEGMRFLLRQEQDPNAQFKGNDWIFHGQNALIAAADAEQLETMRFLAHQAGIKMDLPDSQGRSALFYSAQARFLEGVAFLANFPDVDMNRGDASGHTPLMVAALKGYDDVVELLLKDPRVDPTIGWSSIQEMVKNKEIASLVEAEALKRAHSDGEEGLGL